jgi:hypothetical protein
MPNYRKIILRSFLIFSILAEFLCNLCPMTVMVNQQCQNMNVTICDVPRRVLKTMYCTSIYIFDGTVPSRVSPCFLFGGRAVLFRTAAGYDSGPVSDLFTQPTASRPVLQLPAYLWLIL